MNIQFKKVNKKFQSIEKVESSQETYSRSSLRFYRLRGNLELPHEINYDRLLRP